VQRNSFPPMAEKKKVLHHAALKNRGVRD